MLTGPTKTVLQAGLEAELSEQLGYDKHASEGRDGGNLRNGTRPKMVLSEVGSVPWTCPGITTAASNRSWSESASGACTGVDEMVISLTAKGLTTGAVSADLAEVYRTSVSPETISKITEWDPRRDGRVVQPAARGGLRRRRSWTRW